jgi:hypothetical protein
MSPPIGDIEEVVANVVTQKMHGAVLANIDSGKRSHVIHTADS